MPFTHSDELNSILYPRIETTLLEGYWGGVFNEEQSKFYAATLVKISDVDYDDFEHHHSLFIGSSSMFHDHEKVKKFITPDSWQNKSTHELIEENIYHYFSISFVGMLYEDEWFILKSLAFYGDQKTEDELKSFIAESASNAEFWISDLFVPKKPFNYKRSGEEITLRDVQFEEFENEPYLVAILKQEKKEKINRAFVTYFEEEYIKPFLLKLRIAFPAEYVGICALRINYTAIFPKHKKYIIFCALVATDAGKWRLKYYLVDILNDFFYEWVYFKSDEYDFSFFYSDLIINDLKTISNWNDDAFLDSSRTMDDERFWNEYVFKESNGVQMYLNRFEFK
jgi:hypothetical protein